MNVPGQQTQQPARLEIRLGAGFSKQNINVWFVATPSIQLQIKHVMKASVKVQKLAAPLDDFASSAAATPVTSLNRTPPADVMLHPEKVATVSEVAIVSVPER